MTMTPPSAPQIWSNTRVRSTPFTSRVEAAGVQAYTVYNHMLLAVAFRPLEEDYWHLKESVQVWDVSCQRQVEIVGPDAAELIQLMTPRNLSKANVGRCLYAPMVNGKGGLLNDPVILKLADDRFWLSIADFDMALWADALALGMGFDVSIFEPDVNPLAVQGPKAEELMTRVLGDEVASIGFFKFDHLEFQDHAFAVARTGWSKQGGFEIYVDRNDLALPLWDALFEAGQDLDVRPGMPNVIERIEGGLVSYGGDATVENNPLECRLESYCHLDADNTFIGKDALLAVRENGIERRLMGLLIDTDTLAPVRTRWPVNVDGVKVGELTSGTTSPSFKQGIGLAMLERPNFEVGLDVVVESPGGPLTATVTDLPFELPN